MTYEQAVSWLFEQLPMFQRQGEVAYKKDLSRTKEWCDILDNPQNNFESIHIAGTNGKGSTSHMCASVLQEAGYRVGLLTSPHLVDFRERIRINGKPIDESFLVNFICEHKANITDLKASFFEITTGLAFYYFSEKKVDIAIIETGLGGELDSTNVIEPLICGITNIGWDHMHILGNSLNEIAQAKAGIIKQSTPVVLGEIELNVLPVFIDKAQKLNAPIKAVDYSSDFEYTLDLKGEHQNKNARLTTTIINTLPAKYKITNEQLTQGLCNVIANTGIQGRWQVIDKKPFIVLDTAHNKDGIEEVVKQINKTKHQQLHLVLGFVKEKSVAQLITLFPSDAHYYFCAPTIPRAYPIAELKNELGIQDNYHYFKSVSEALKKAKDVAEKEDLIYVGGSTFVVADALSI